MKVLGFDSSTQALKADVYDTANGKLVASRVVHFDNELSHYGTSGGVLSGDREGEYLVPPLMPIMGIDRALGALREHHEGLLGQIEAIGFSGQQHMLVHLNQHASEVLGQTDGGTAMTAWLAPALARPLSANWMDRSTGTECEELRALCGGVEGLATLTGSNAELRFAASQLRKLAKTGQAAWERTAHLQLLSSFLASVFAGRLAPIDYSDGFGMNLANVTTGQWATELFDHVAPGLAARLPALVPPLTRVGTVSRYFVERYGFSPRAVVVTGMGDNPASYLGCGMFEEGGTVISLGTSDTLMAASRSCRPTGDGYGHIFGSHQGADSRLLLACFLNGSLTREQVRKDAGAADWDAFELLARASTAPQGFILPWFSAEITPRAPAGPQYVELNPHCPADICRGIFVGQALALRSRAERFGIAPSQVVVTGGASKSMLLCQLLANVFQCPVQRSAVAGSAALGAALGAAYVASGSSDWRAITSAFTFVKPGEIFKPEPMTAPWAGGMLRRYREVEDARLADATA